MYSKLNQNLPRFLVKMGVKLETHDHGKYVKAVITFKDYRRFIYISKKYDEGSFMISDLITRFLYDHGLELPNYKNARKE